MKKFVVQVYGRNFRMPFVERRRERIRLTGFHVVRCVEADSASEAEYAAMDLIRRDPKLRGVPRNSPTDPSIMEAVEICEVEAFSIDPPGSGYVFFHGRGADRPRSLELAEMPSNIPPEIRKAIAGRYGRPKRKGPRES